MSTPRYEGLDAMRVAASFGVVFLHVFVATGAPQSLDRLVKLRDFALPFLVMTAFFLLTVSLMRKSSVGFGEFFRSRIRRLWIPMIAWTFIYSLIFSSSDPIVFLTGYRHLWFLQFIFLTSLAAYPIISCLGKLSHTSLSKSFAICAGTALVYAILFWFWVRSYIDSDNFGSESDISLQIFVSQARWYILFIPIAVGLALASDKIRAMLAESRFRHAVLIFVLAAMVLHVGADTSLGTREIYGVAVFVAALLPWAKISSGRWQMLAAYSYGIYILHFIPTQILWALINQNNVEFGGAGVFGIALLIYLASFAAAVSVRKVFPADWLIPLVSIPLSESRESLAGGGYGPVVRLPDARIPLRENAGTEYV